MLIFLKTATCFLVTGAKESVDRWEMCIVTTQKYFRLAMGAIYSKNNVALKDTRNGVSIYLVASLSCAPVACLYSSASTRQQQCQPSALMSCLYSMVVVVRGFVAIAVATHFAIQQHPLTRAFFRVE